MLAVVAIAVVDATELSSDSSSPGRDSSGGSFEPPLIILLNSVSNTSLPGIGAKPIGFLMPLNARLIE
jgi:hypothetical protein